MILFNGLNCKHLSAIGGASTILHLFSALTFINSKIEMVSSTLSPDMMTIDNAINENYANAVSTLTNEAATLNDGGGGVSGASWLDANMQKRAWQQLQGAWGKRRWNIEPITHNAIMAEKLIPIPTAGDGRPLAMEEHPEVLKYSMLYLMNRPTLDHLTDNKQQQHPFEANSNEDGTINGYKLNDDLFASMEQQSDNDNILNEKRNWKSMNAAWGKRRNAPAWNKFRGAWGKREPGWNNLKGMWGKRSSKDWQKLQAGWGKRSSSTHGEMN